MAGKTAWAANFMTEKNALTDQIKHLQQQISKDKMNLDDGAQTRARVIKNYIFLWNSSQNLRQRVKYFTHLVQGIKNKSL